MRLPNSRRSSSVDRRNSSVFSERSSSDENPLKFSRAASKARVHSNLDEIKEEGDIAEEP